MTARRSEHLEGLATAVAWDEETLAELRARLVEWEGLDVAEAARVLRCTRTAFKVRLHRARRRFAQRLLATDEPGTPAARRPRPSTVSQGSNSR